MAKVDMLHVPYKGAAPLRQDLLGGVVDAAFESVLGNLSFVRAGTMVALGTASQDRLPAVAGAGRWRVRFCQHHHCRRRTPGG
ncbi:MAG: tripartite tricarboxylate transporter substrate-binding protein [Burkholderiaceae bacterium]